MTREQAYIIINDIVRDVLGDEVPVVADGTRTGDLQGWDSLVQINLMAAVEIRFGVEIRCCEADEVVTFADLVDLILEKSPKLVLA
jgi:acyl carrier protein